MCVPTELGSVASAVPIRRNQGTVKRTTTAPLAMSYAKSRATHLHKEVLRNVDLWSRCRRKDAGQLRKVTLRWWSLQFIELA